MSSVIPIDNDHDFQTASQTATDRIPAATLDAQITAVKNKLNEILVAIAKALRDDDTLVDGLVRLRNLHAEVAAIVASQGWQPKASCALATTGNITLSGEQTIDGTLTAASRVLVKDQTTKSQNGIYTTGAGAWTRATDADAATELGYAVVTVTGGSSNLGTSWVVTAANSEITLGTTDIVWVPLAGSLQGGLAFGGTGATTPADWPTARRRMVRVVVDTNINTASPGAVRDGITLSPGDRILLVAQGIGANNGIHVWNGAATPLTRPNDYRTGDTLQAFTDVEVFVREGDGTEFNSYAGSVWRLDTTGAITIGTTATTWRQVAVARPTALPAVHAASTVNVSVTLPLSSTIGGTSVSNGFLVLLAGQSSGVENGPWIFNGIGAAMTRPAWWNSRMQPQRHRYRSVLVQEGDFQGTTWFLDTAGAITVDTTVTTWLRAIVPGQIHLPACRAVATSNVSLAAPGAAIDGVALANGDRVLLTAQSTASQNGPYLWNGASSALTRPPDFQPLSNEAVYKDLLVLVTEGASFGMSVWRVTSTGEITVDTTSIAFALMATPHASENEVINPCGIVGAGVDFVTATPDLFGYGKVAIWKGAIAGSTVAGTLTQGTARSVGRTGFSILWQNVTTTGSGVVKFRFHVRAAKAVKFRNQTATVSFQIRHDVGSACNVVSRLSRANATDNFAAVTTIATSAATSVASGVNGYHVQAGVAMGETNTGVMLDIEVTVGAVTAKNVEITEVQLELGSIATPCEILANDKTVWEEAFYFQRFGGVANAANANVFAAGSVHLTTNARFCFQLIRPMRAVPTVTFSAAADFRIHAGGTLFAVSAISALVSTIPSSFYISADGAGMTVGQGACLVNDANDAPTITCDARF